MNMKIIKFIALLLVFAGGFASCKNNDNIDMSEIGFSNIDSLYAQPLPVIQKCVEGKWKWFEICTCGFIGLRHLSNTVVDITKESVIITGDDGLNQTFQYSWKEYGTPYNYTTYVMWNKEKDTGKWYFDKIINDTLVVCTYDLNAGGSPDIYVFYKIKP